MEKCFHEQLVELEKRIRGEMEQDFSKEREILVHSLETVKRERDHFKGVCSSWEEENKALRQDVAVLREEKKKWMDDESKLREEVKEITMRCETMERLDFEFVGGSYHKEWTPPENEGLKCFQLNGVRFLRDANDYLWTICTHDAICVKRDSGEDMSIHDCHDYLFGKYNPETKLIDTSYGDRYSDAAEYGHWDEKGCPMFRNLDCAEYDTYVIDEEKCPVGEYCLNNNHYLRDKDGYIYQTNEDQPGLETVIPVGRLIESEVVTIIPITRKTEVIDTTFQNEVMRERATMLSTMIIQNKKKDDKVVRLSQWNIPEDGFVYDWRFQGVTYFVNSEGGVWERDAEGNLGNWVGMVVFQNGTPERIDRTIVEPEYYDE